MAQRKLTLPIHKVTLNLFKGDWEELAEMHPKLGPSRVIRELVHSHIRKVKDAAAQRQAPLSQNEMDEII